MIGKTLSHFTITAKLGEGGMGTVYRAKDAKLGREVAIKILPRAFTADPDRLARFAREARVLASLNHPHIAGIHEVDETEVDGSLMHFLVMELAAGETLAEHLVRGQLPLGRAVAIAQQIAEALEAAHERGIVHRDLKPANITVNTDDQVKILDFGLAKVRVRPVETSLDLSDSPTLTAQMTRAGTILGTAAYMSPEQARGQEVDKRADIWAFGCVLYEMLAGERAFGGETSPGTLARILEREPAWDRLPDTTPTTVRTLIRRCLAKDCSQRLKDIGDARLEIEEAISGPMDGLERAAHGRLRERRRSWAYVFAIVSATALVTWLLVKPGFEPEQMPMRSFILADSALLKGPLPRHENNLRASISPDGTRVVFHAQGRLWLRKMDGIEPTSLDGTDGGEHAFWSRDGSRIGFFVGPELRQFSLRTGVSTVIATFPEDYFLFGGTWGAGDRIVVATATGDGARGLQEVSARGGKHEMILAPSPAQGEYDFHYPVFLGDGRTLAFVVHRRDFSYRSVELWDGRERRKVFEAGPLSYVQRLSYDPSSGHLLAATVRVNPGIWAIPLDTSTLEPIGEPKLVIPHGVGPSVSSDGTLLYVDGLRFEPNQMVRVSRDGQLGPTVGKRLWDMRWPLVSPDGKRIAVRAREEDPGDTWIQDVGRNVATRITSTPVWDAPMAWMNAGTDLLLAHSPYLSVSELGGFFRCSADGTGENQLLLEGSVWGATLPATGGIMVYEIEEAENWDLWQASLADLPSSEPLVATSANERSPALSADGALLAYTSDISGEVEVYVQALPRGERVQVSSRGGRHPRWSRAGDELFYVEEDVLMAASVERKGPLRVATPVHVFAGKDVSSPLDYFGSRLFDVASDGGFYVIQGLMQGEPRLVAQENWRAKLSQQGL